MDLVLENIDYSWEVLTFITKVVMKAGGVEICEKVVILAGRR